MTAYNPLFLYCKFLFFYQNEEVYKKSDINIFKIGQAVEILSSKFQIWNYFEKYLSPHKNCVNPVNFQERIDFFVSWSLMDPF